MTTYRLYLPTATFDIIVGGDVLIHAPPPLDRFIGQPWQNILRLLEQFKCEVEPLLPTTTSDWIPYNDVTYEIKWNHDRTMIRRMSKHQNGRIADVRFDQLPHLLKMALC